MNICQKHYRMSPNKSLSLVQLLKLSLALSTIFHRKFKHNYKQAFNRVAPVRFGSVTVWGWKGSIGSGFRFRRFLYKKGFFSVFQYIFRGKDGSGFGFWKTVPAVPVPLSVSGKTV